MVEEPPPVRPAAVLRFTLVSVSWIAFELRPAVVERTESDRAVAAPRQRSRRLALLAFAPLAPRSSSTEALRSRTWQRPVALGLNLVPRARLPPDLLRPGRCAASRAARRARAGQPRRRDRVRRPTRRRREDLDRWLSLGSPTLTLFATLDLLFEPVFSAMPVRDSGRLPAAGRVRRDPRQHLAGDSRIRIGPRGLGGACTSRAWDFTTGTRSTCSRSRPHGDVRGRHRSCRDAASRQQSEPRGAEARFATLALSSAAGRAHFDAALRRYVDFLTADGMLEVELEIDAAVRLAPDEQMELFPDPRAGRARRHSQHAHAHRAWVTIGHRGEERLVTWLRVRPPQMSQRQGLHAPEGIRRSAVLAPDAPGSGTALEVVLAVPDDFTLARDPAAGNPQTRSGPPPTPSSIRTLEAAGRARSALVNPDRPQRRTALCPRGLVPDLRREPDRRRPDDRRLRPGDLAAVPSKEKG